MTNLTDADRKQAEQARMLRLCLDDQKTPMWSERKKMLAQEMFGDYRAYFEAGFTADQAMCLVIQMRGK